MAYLEILGLIGTFAAILSLLGLWGSRQTNQLIRDMHAVTQLTMTDMAKGFRESQQQLGQAITDSQQTLGAIVERIDQRADERHREVVEIIRALRTS